LSPARRVSPAIASSLLLVVLLVSALLLVYAGTLSNAAIQALAMLVSMVLVFYAGHPLGHFVTAAAYGVRTEYFFVGRSDFRKLKLKPMSLVGGLMPTIGTKLNKDQLASLPPRRRGYVFGAGVIYSNTAVGIELLHVLVAGFSLLAILLGTLFFLVMLATEFLFSTKVGDLGKMRKEFDKQSPGTTVGRPA
jgi:hypothetical protein